MSAPSTVDAISALGGAEGQLGWQTLVERHGADVWRLIHSRSRDANEAEDAYQDFWMALPRAAASFKPVAGADPERSARAWLLRVAYTTAIDRLRRRRPPTVTAQRGAAMDANDLPASARLLVEEPQRPGTEDLRDRELLLMRVQGALADLSEAHRRPLLLHIVGGLSYEDLAADLRCTVTTARVRVHRALKRLRGLVGGQRAELDEGALAGLLVPLLLTVPPAPALASALTGVPLALGAPIAGAKAAAAAGGVAGLPIAAGVATLAVGAVVAVTLGLPARAAPLPPAMPAPVVRLLDDFERDDPRLQGTSFPGTAPELSLAPAPAGGTSSGNALRFGWSEAHNVWIDCHYADGDPHRQPLTGVIASAQTIVSMQVWAPQTTRLTHLAVRFTDADGEIFEWRHALADQGRTGWRTVEFPLDPARAAQWDKSPIANHRVETPMRLLGYAIEIGGRGSRTGVVIIDDVRLMTP